MHSEYGMSDAERAVVAELRADEFARVELVKQGIALSRIAALYPLTERVERYLRSSCKLEPWVDVVPTADAGWWKATRLCEDTCHHYAHAFGHPERLRHSITLPSF